MVNQSKIVSETVKKIGSRLAGTIPLINKDSLVLSGTDNIEIDSISIREPGRPHKFTSLSASPTDYDYIKGNLLIAYETDIAEEFSTQVNITITYRIVNSTFYGHRKITRYLADGNPMILNLPEQGGELATANTYYYYLAELSCYFKTDRPDFYEGVTIQFDFISPSFYNTSVYLATAATGILSNALTIGACTPANVIHYELQNYGQNTVEGEIFASWIQRGWDSDDEKMHIKFGNGAISYVDPGLYKYLDFKNWTIAYDVNSTVVTKDIKDTVKLDLKLISVLGIE